MNIKKTSDILTEMRDHLRFQVSDTQWVERKGFVTDILERYCPDTEEGTLAVMVFLKAMERMEKEGNRNPSKEDIINLLNGCRSGCFKYERGDVVKKGFFERLNEWNRFYMAIVAIATLWFGCFFAYSTFAYAVPRHDWPVVCLGIVLTISFGWVCWLTSNMVTRG